MMRNESGWSHPREPVGKGQTLVARKRIGLARSRGAEINVAGDDENQDNSGQCVHGTCRHGRAEHIKERIASAILERVVDRWDAEQISDEQYQAHQAIDRVAADDGARNDDAGVFDFFRHVCRCVGA